MIVKILIAGRVQGVFFRAYIEEKAVELDLKGWVRNNSDGSLEAIFEGSDDKIQQILTWCKQGPSAAKVDELKVEKLAPEDLNEKLIRFYIKYD